ncbi:hypothetical protein ABW19_dt0205335 [Dactylella cylindrospora]|nr:hypothetical protein ABW19_dt0205335 [Dactylella cylindrospora]
MPYRRSYYWTKKKKAAKKAAKEIFIDENHRIANELRKKIVKLEKEKRRLLKTLPPEEAAELERQFLQIEKDEPEESVPEFAKSPYFRISAAEWREQTARKDAMFKRRMMRRLKKLEDESVVPDDVIKDEEDKVPDVFNGESMFPPMEEVYPPEIWGTANYFPRSESFPEPKLEEREAITEDEEENDEEDDDDEYVMEDIELTVEEQAARDKIPFQPTLGFLKLNHKFYVIREKHLPLLESYGFIVDDWKERAKLLKQDEVEEPVAKPDDEDVIMGL